LPILLLGLKMKQGDRVFSRFWGVMAGLVCRGLWIPEISKLFFDSTIFGHSRPRTHFSAMSKRLQKIFWSPIKDVYREEGQGFSISFLL